MEGRGCRHPPGDRGHGSPACGDLGRSWWTDRATEQEVKPGFTKEAVLRPAKEDPRSEDGVLSRVGELLSALAGKS